jgi:hypothetical protein
LRNAADVPRLSVPKTQTGADPLVKTGHQQAEHSKRDQHFEKAEPALTLRFDPPFHDFPPSLRPGADAEPACLDQDRPAAARGSPGNLYLDIEQGRCRTGFSKICGLPGRDRAGIQPPMISATIITFDLARCHRSRPAKGGKVGLPRSIASSTRPAVLAANKPPVAA